jgi:hypothetical protein
MYQGLTIKRVAHQRMDIPQDHPYKVIKIEVLIDRTAVVQLHAMRNPWTTTSWNPKKN